MDKYRKAAPLNRITLSTVKHHSNFFPAQRKDSEMFGNALLKAAGFASIISSAVALGCVPRNGREMISNTGFEFDEYDWNWSNGAVQQPSTPSFPAHSGLKAVYVFQKSLSKSC